MRINGRMTKRTTKKDFRSTSILTTKVEWVPKLPTRSSVELVMSTSFHCGILTTPSVAYAPRCAALKTTSVS